ncbi:hypothetical protein OIE66_02345 [Nonomuraea sp. NBC_01738]|uniref:hypothetical protein n=1 Tax=Nonomuraea sp. NBC_01738 TaxID=2976003 RepID=UPI002E0F3A88|nr:hypothetical protein OIE66_02345 [Nonomuraea sp. NBC_01738]
MAQPGDKRGLIFGAIVVVIAAIGLYATMWPKTGEPAEVTGGGSRTSSAAPAPVTSKPLATASDGPFDIYAYLPMTRQQLAAAADLAERFTVAYGTFRWDEEPAAYAERVKVFTTGELANVLTRTLTSPGNVEQNKADQVVSTTTARMKEIRQVSAGSIVFVVAASQKIVAKSGTTEKAESYAVTLTPVGSDWRVFDLQLADEGQDGDSEG